MGGELTAAPSVGAYSGAPPPRIYTRARNVREEFRGGGRSQRSQGKPEPGHSGGGERERERERGGGRRGREEELLEG